MYACMHVCICVISARQKASRKSAMSSYKKKKKQCVPTHTQKKKNTISNIYYSYFFFFLFIFYFSVYSCLARQAYGRVKERKMCCLWTHSAWERKVVQLAKKKKTPLASNSNSEEAQRCALFFFSYVTLFFYLFIYLFPLLITIAVRITRHGRNQT